MACEPHLGLWRSSTIFLCVAIPCPADYKGGDNEGKEVKLKKVQHPPVHKEGWMISEQETVFHLGSSCLANHGGHLSYFFSTYLLITHKVVETALLMYQPSTLLIITNVPTSLPIYVYRGPTSYIMGYQDETRSIDLGEVHPQLNCNRHPVDLVKSPRWLKDLLKVQTLVGYFFLVGYSYFATWIEGHSWELLSWMQKELFRLHNFAFSISTTFLAENTFFWVKFDRPSVVNWSLQQLTE